MKGLMLCLGLILGFTFRAQALATEVSGQARVSDGDTVEIGGKSVRLDAIDAPETDQFCLDVKGNAWTCGMTARDELAKHGRGHRWRCEGSKEDRGRLIATCTMNGEDVNSWLVSQGWALAYTHYSRRYDAEEKSAREAHKGLWSGSFCKPWEWRDGNCKDVLGADSVPVDALLKLKGLYGKPPGDDCVIKANLKAKHGECIYHMPGSHGFSRLKMDKPGRQWFCSQKDAQVAGCRPSFR